MIFISKGVAMIRISRWFPWQPLRVESI